MRYLREASDLHLDWDHGSFHQTRMADPTKRITSPMDMLWLPPPMEGDLDTAFIIAGDIWTADKFISQCYPGTLDSWLTRVARQFKYVVFVLGNHDYWRTNVRYAADKIKKTIKLLNNVFLLERDAVVLDQVKFVGGTLWTDYNRGDPLVMHRATSYMCDYDHIKYGHNFRRVRPMDLYEIFRNTKSFIFKNVKRDSPEQKVVVVTHMAPSYESVDDHYRKAYFTEVNFLYYSDIEEQIRTEGKDIDLWFHGHMHHSDDYHLDNVRVILNPRGYLLENSLFNPELRIEL